MELTKDQLITFYTLMVRTRKLDELIVNALKSGKAIGFFHSGQGSEAVPIGGCTFNLREDDYLYPHHRGHAIGYFLARGLSPKPFVASHLGKVPQNVEGPEATERGVFGVSGTIGASFVLSAGMAITAKKNGKGQITACFFGDGAANRGTMHEAMNLASVWKLPIVWICENNLYAQYMPLKDSMAREDISDLAASYNMPGVIVDGQDVLAVHEAVKAAVDRARSGEGPSLVECKTYRYRGHSEGGPDISHYEPRPAEEVEAWKQRDPIKLFRENLLQQGVLTDADVERIDKEIDAEVESLEKYADECPIPKPEDPSVLDKLLYAD
ncbi:MAG: thiamine pyrophosphate-dependent dehydrogenase E1 component subunit alpha [Deltaproteobacteria bacterium]|nr:thiamine pyrophosphate-dependent dehydrogenase E1 component subunit alpha [Deltaproteobacteria bacterium]